MAKKQQTFERRKRRVRASLRKHSGSRPRLSVFRSNKNIYAQIINDRDGVTVASASSHDESLKGDLKTGSDTEAAEAVGKLVAARGLEKGIKDVVFDRGGYLYHGRVKALAEGAREGGLEF